MAINFPNNPTPGQRFTDANGKVWEFDGDGWLQGVNVTDAAAGGDMQTAVYDINASNIVDRSESVGLQARTQNGTINVDQIVHYLASVGDPVQYVTVALAQADNVATMPALGIARNTITTSGGGTILAFGQVHWNTTGQSVGDPVYVHPSIAGAITFTQPNAGAGEIVQQIGRVSVVGGPGVGVINFNFQDSVGGPAAGDVTGPAGATQFSVPKFGDTTGKLLIESALVIDANDDGDGLRDFAVTRNLTSDQDTLVGRDALVKGGVQVEGQQATLSTAGNPRAALDIVGDTVRIGGHAGTPNLPLALQLNAGVNIAWLVVDKTTLEGIINGDLMIVGDLAVGKVAAMRLCGGEDRTDLGDSGDDAQIVARGVTDVNKQLMIGFDTVRDFGALQANHVGTGYAPIVMQQHGSNVGVGRFGSGAAYRNPDTLLHLRTDNPRIRLQRRIGAAEGGSMAYEFKTVPDEGVGQCKAAVYFASSGAGQNGRGTLYLVNDIVADTNDYDPLVDWKLQIRTDGDVQVRQNINDQLNQPYPRISTVNAFTAAQRGNIAEVAVTPGSPDTYTPNLWEGNSFWFNGAGTNGAISGAASLLNPPANGTSALAAGQDQKGEMRGVTDATGTLGMASGWKEGAAIDIAANTEFAVYYESFWNFNLATPAVEHRALAVDTWTAT